MSKLQTVNCPHLPKVDAPVEWAVIAGGVLYTSQIPIRTDGTMETGAIEEQTHLTFNNLKLTLEAAGSSMEDLCQVQIFLTNPDDFATVNTIYKDYIAAPYPNRATVVAAGLLAPGIAIEIVAHAYVGK